MLKFPRCLCALAGFLFLCGVLAADSVADDVVEKWVHRHASSRRLSFPWGGGVVDAAGNVAVTGYVDADTGSDLYVAKYDANGGLLWDRAYDGPAHEGNNGYGLAFDAAGNVIVTGNSSHGGNNFDLYVAKYAAADGTLLWDVRTPGLSSFGSRVAVDHAGNVIITGCSKLDGKDGDFYTAKYAGDTGALRWERFYHGPGTGDDDGYYVAVDTADNVVVSGTSRNTAGNDDWYTAKYSAADGTILWERRYDGPGHGDDSPHGISLDPVGNVVIAGWRRNASGNDDAYVAKYASGNGTVLWEVSYDGAGHGNDYFYSAATDAAGNVAVTGSFKNIDGFDDAYTALYAASDGALLWEKRFNGPAGKTDYGVAVTFDHAGNVLIFGDASVPSYLDAYTAKYARTDGALVWEKYYNGPADSDERGCSIAVDNLDNVIVVGGSSNGFGYDFATIKYGPADADADHDGLADAWEIARFGSTAAHSANEDSDHDGIPEVMELAFDRDPTKPDAAVLPQPVVENGYLTLTLTKRLGASFVVESAGSPLASAFSADTTTVLVNDSNILKVRDNFPVEGNPQRFLRVKVTGTPSQ